jgi:serine/threonine protein kinase
MPLDFLTVGSSPIPGYECLQQLGGSPFTSLWQVRAPDGSTRLWKVVDLAMGNAAIETRNLELLVRLKHPALNPLLKYHTLPERKSLILETAAPFKSLRDRLKESRHQATPGIPVYELAPWMTSVAEGLDFLNSPQHEFQGKKVAIYHRELKPENMLLFREAGSIICKVGDFGLAKPVSEQSNQHSQGLANYDYDPPEFYEGTTSPTCDQYSLAIACYELRTGTLPFTGSMLEQLSARINDSPNLNGVETELERAVLQRALQKNPAKRFGSCREFLAAWVQAMNAAEAEKAASQESPSMRIRRSPAKVGSAGGSPSSSNNLRLPPRAPARMEPAEPVLAGERNGGASSVMRGLPPRSKVFNPNEPNEPNDVVAYVPPPVSAEEVEEDITTVIQRAIATAGSPPPETAPRECASKRMRRVNKPSTKVEPLEDQKVPMAWVVIISMIVLGAVAVVAKELAVQAIDQQATSSIRAVDDQSHRAVVH